MIKPFIGRPQFSVDVENPPTLPVRLLVHVRSLLTSVAFAGLIPDPLHNAILPSHSSVSLMSSCYWSNWTLVTTVTPHIHQTARSTIRKGSSTVISPLRPYATFMFPYYTGRSVHDVHMRSSLFFQIFLGTAISHRSTTTSDRLSFPFNIPFTSSKDLPPSLSFAFAVRCYS
ncbi:uncharacterized protein UDID_17383 [Ustilago sp. UG-2017a]|nr:uncharacterized protein UDID_17383 [Ustilago sp. UG-2017a]